MSCVLASFRKMRSGNVRVASTATGEELKMAVPSAAEHDPKDSYAAAAASPPRNTRPTSAKVGAIAKRGNGDVADSEPVARGNKQPPGAAAKVASSEPMTKSQLVAHLSDKEQEIADLKAKIAEAKKAKQPKVTISTEVAGVSETSTRYWVDGSGNKSANKIAVKSKQAKPKPESKDIHWPGYCLVGCSCDARVKKAEEPSKTAMADPSACPRRPSLCEGMPATAVLQQLLQLLRCCSTFEENSVPCGINPRTQQPHMASHAARKPGKHIRAPTDTVPKGKVCAPCDHQGTIDKIKKIYGATPPHLAPTVDDGKDLSV